jgi:uncharacterized lipoprotein NlpE involved in copper resistance
MMRAMLSIALALVSLTGCGEKAQTGLGVKSDQAAYKGVDSTATPFASPGWTAGDKTSWEQSLKARAQNSQNEYNKMVVSK